MSHTNRSDSPLAPGSAGGFFIRQFHQAPKRACRRAGVDRPGGQLQALFKGRGLVGDKWLVDHIHPNIRGHQLLANLLAQELARQGVIRPAADWEERRAERYQEHRDSLNELYFLKGKQRLENLRLWAQGGVSRVRPAPGRPTKEGGSGVAPKE